MWISGRFLTLVEINNFACQVVIEKMVNGKKKPIAITALGRLKDRIIKEWKPVKKEKIQGEIYLESSLYKGKYYTTAYFRNFEVMRGVPKLAEDELDFEGVGNITDDDGNILL